MTRVNNTDQVLLLLREQLQRLGKSKAGRGARAGSTASATGRPLARLQQLAALDQLSDEDFRRNLVRAVLTEQWGEGASNDPAFLAIAEDVFRILGDSEEGRSLLDRASAQLRAGG